MPELLITALPYDHPDVAALTTELQQEYVVRYGGHDKDGTLVAEFAPPAGLFLVGYLESVPVACGGWRGSGPGGGFLDGDVEVKRMYVRPQARGRGAARALLAELERTARVAGRHRVLLETGRRQPEAIALYESSGYDPVPPFGFYAGYSGCRFFGKPLAAAGTSQTTEETHADLRAG